MSYGLQAAAKSVAHNPYGIVGHRHTAAFDIVVDSTPQDNPPTGT